MKKVILWSVLFGFVISVIASLLQLTEFWTYVFIFVGAIVANVLARTDFKKKK